MALCPPLVFDPSLETPYYGGENHNLHWNFTSNPYYWLYMSHDYLNAFPHAKFPETFGWFSWWNDCKSLICLVFNFLSYAMSVNQFTSPLSGHSSDCLLMFAPYLFWQGNLVCFFRATKKTIFMYVLGVCDICVRFAVLQHFEE